MLRREFFKFFATPALALFGFSLFGCGRDEESNAKSTDLSLAERFKKLGTLRVWAYYVPMTSYQGIIEDFEGRNILDRKAIYEEVRKRTNRVNGQESDGTRNPVSLDIDALQNSEEYLRLRFWHDDFGEVMNSSHTLYVFKRYMEDLEAGKKVFVATGMYQNHFHIVLIEPAVS